MEEKKPFCLLRPGDGEYQIMMGQKFGTQDKWTYGGGDLGAELRGALTVAASQPDTFIGIACRGCWPQEKTDWYIRSFNIQLNQLTYANIVCNANWSTFIGYLVEKKLPLHHIGPGSSQSHLNIVSHFKVDELLLDSWDSCKSEFMKRLESWICATAEAPKVFTFSAGPITKVIIPYLVEKYPGHFYIDVGSAFDYFLKGQTNRGYVLKADPLHHLVCDFTNGHKDVHM